MCRLGVFVSILTLELAVAPVLGQGIDPTWSREYGLRFSAFLDGSTDSFEG